VFPLESFPMNGCVLYVALAKKSFLLNNEIFIRDRTFENLGRVDFRLSCAHWLHVFFDGCEQLQRKVLRE
jgi:hypothetical protein